MDTTFFRISFMPDFPGSAPSPCQNTLLACLVFLALPVADVAAAVQITETAIIPFNRAAAATSCIRRLEPQVVGLCNARRVIDYKSESEWLNYVNWFASCTIDCAWVTATGEAGSHWYDQAGSTDPQPACPSGYFIDWGTMTCKRTVVVNPAKSYRRPPTTCNPVQIAIGNKLADHTDYASATLAFTRSYNSLLRQPERTIGVNVRHGYASLLRVSRGARVSTVFAERADGSQLLFSLIDGRWTPESDVAERLVELAEGGWRLQTRDGGVETYNATGRLQMLTDPRGLTRNLSYADAGELMAVSDTFGRALAFTYDKGGRITTLTDPGQGVTRYTYDAQDRLIRITGPDQHERRYLYENATFPQALTGIMDESGTRYATYAYDSQGRTTSTEHAGAVNRVALTYGSNQTTVTDTLGTPRTYHFTPLLGVPQPSSISQAAGSGCDPSASALTYDANGNVAARTDFNGIVTTYRHDLARILETERTEAVGRPEARTVRTTWHPYWRQPIRIEEAGRTTTWILNGDGGALCAPPTATVPSIDGGEHPISVVCEKRVTNGALSDGAESRTWRWTYNDFGRPLSETTPDGAVTTHDYWPADASCPGADLGPGRDKGCRGELRQTTNPVGHVTRFTRYNAHSQIEETVDPNGLVSHYAYDLRERLVRTEVGGEVTTYTYDPVGQLIGVTHPDGGTLTYTYDAAHRLVAIADGAGNRIDYTLDDAGNRIGEDVRDASGRLARSISRSYDALGRLQAISGAPAIP